MVSGQSPQRVLIAAHPDDAGFFKKPTAVHRLVPLEYVSEVDFRAADNRPNYVVLRVGDSEALNMPVS